MLSQFRLSVTRVIHAKTGNGKCHISGSASSKTLGSIFKKSLQGYYVGDLTPHASIGVNWFKGGVSACVKLSPSGVYFFFF